MNAFSVLGFVNVFIFNVLSKNEIKPQHLGPFTHISVGATTGVLLFKDKLEIGVGEVKATLFSALIGAVLGFLPDVDLMNKKIHSTIVYMERHRKWTHSFFVHIVFSLMISMVISLIVSVENFDNTTFIEIALYCFLILGTHVALDFCTSWGVYYFYPVKTALKTKSVSVWDFVVTLLMVAQLLIIAQYVYNKTQGEEVGSINYIPIILVLTYLIATFLLRLIFIVPKFKEQLASQKITYYEIEVKPTFFNAILWTVNVRVKEGYLIGYYSVFQKKKEIEFISVPINQNLIKYDDPEFLALISRFKKVVSHWYSFSEIAGELYINDVRYGYKSPNLNETEFAVPYLITEQKKGKGLDVVSIIKLKKRWWFYLIKRFFKA